jgi:hypothetical protein
MVWAAGLPYEQNPRRARLAPISRARIWAKGEVRRCRSRRLFSVDLESPVALVAEGKARVRADGDYGESRDSLDAEALACCAHLTRQGSPGWTFRASIQRRTTPLAPGVGLHARIAYCLVAVIMTARALRSRGPAWGLTGGRRAR